jgi:hypothetical protein
LAVFVSPSPNAYISKMRRTTAACSGFTLRTT